VADPARLTGILGSLVLVRHGESTWITEGRFQGRSDPPLSPLGERQAAAVADRLADPSRSPALPLPPGPPIGVWHSPLRRAAVVAARIAAPHGIRATPLDDLIELAQGSWEGLTHDEVMERFGTELAAWRRQPVGNHAPGGEPLTDAAVRAGSAADTLLEALRAASPLEGQADATGPGSSPLLGYGPGGAAHPWLVAVAHDGLLRLLLFSLLELPPDRFWALPFGLCSITVVEVRGGHARLRAHNLADHLAHLEAAARPTEDRIIEDAPR
jgi:probable phosphoglycerate mutase